MHLIKARIIHLPCAYVRNVAVCETRSNVPVLLVQCGFLNGTVEASFKWFSWGPAR